MYTYVIMKKNVLSPLSYHHNGFVATHALGDMMHGYKLLVPMNQRASECSTSQARGVM